MEPAGPAALASDEDGLSHSPGSGVLPSTDAMSDTHARLNELVRRARQGDVPAFGLIVAETQAMACAVALSVLRDPGLAQDAAQEAYLRAFRRLGISRMRPAS